MNMNNNMNQFRSSLLLLALATSGCLVNCQFLPQSHLGRLVQSITSPLVISSQAAGYRSNDDSDPNGDSSGYYGPAGTSSGDSSDESGASPRGASAHLTGRGQQLQQQVQGLEQAPSQQRGVPTQQHYYNEDDQGSAPSNNKHTQDYQMGAYLGPSMDDKEINGAFNSNDERDEDDGPAGYDDPSSPSAMGRGRAAASNTYRNNGGEGYGPAAYGRPAAAAAAGGNYDEDGADEDDAPMPRARHQGGRSATGYGRSGLSQAASQYQQRGSSGQSGGASGQSMMAAANGYSPYGYNTGPIDLNGLMAGVNGDPSAGYQVYQGDGSYPGASYYQQQAQGGRQRPLGRSGSSSSSMNNGYYNANANNPNNQDNGYNAAPARGRNNAEDQANNYNDERDNDNDED